MKERPVREVPPPPYAGLRERLIELARLLEGAGRAEEADSLRATVADWWRQQRAWDEQVAQWLGLHHEINNALVGVRGNTQLLLMSPAGQLPGTRERLEVVIRESGRIQEAAGRLRELKLAVGGTGPSSVAA